MDLYCTHRDTQLIRDDLVQLAGQNQLHYFLFAMGELCQFLLYRKHRALPGAALHIMLQRGKHLVD